LEGAVPERVGQCRDGALPGEKAAIPQPPDSNGILTTTAFAAFSGEIAQG